MIQYLLDLHKNSRAFKAVFWLFVAFTVWWISIYARGLTEGGENELFTLSYCIISLIGGIVGLIASKRWGGVASTLGRSIFLLALGLLAQFVGELCYSYYIFVLQVEVPYPSAGDIAYFSSVVFYILAVWDLAKVSGIKFSLKTLGNKVLALVIPVAVLILSYVVLLKDYVPDLSDKFRLFLDFGFPVGQVIYVSIALLALFASNKILGGIMRNSILLLTFALVLQYIADFYFSYAYIQEAVYAGGFTDYLYMASYFLMSLSLVSIGHIYNVVRRT